MGFGWGGKEFGSMEFCYRGGFRFMLLLIEILFLFCFLFYFFVLFSLVIVYFGSLFIQCVMCMVDTQNDMSCGTMFQKLIRVFAFRKMYFYLVLDRMSQL